MKVVYSLDALSMMICQKPAFRSRQEKYPAPTRLSMTSCMQGNGGVLFGPCIQSMQKWRPPSFFWSYMTALHNGLWLENIVSTSNISFVWSFPSSTIGGGILQSLSLKGSSSTTLISCFTRLVHPNSPDSSEKMSWYLVSRAHADVWFAPDLIILAAGGASPFSAQ